MSNKYLEKIAGPLSNIIRRGAAGAGSEISAGFNKNYPSLKFGAKKQFLNESNVAISHRGGTQTQKIQGMSRMLKNPDSEMNDTLHYEGYKK